MKRVNINKPVNKLKPLDVRCSDTRCAQGFHFYTSKKTPKGGELGDCKDCGDDSVDWQRIYKNNPRDIDYTFESLKKELLRHVCWVNKIDKGAIDKAKERGREMILGKAKEIITKKIAKVPTSHYDYLCTPKKGDEIVHYGQHATATCCRKCLERWHNIPQDIVLNESQIDYCVDLVALYIKDRIPDLQKNPQRDKMIA
jgi:hypothetical protein